MNRELAVRTSFYSVLNGAINAPDSTKVPVSDAKKESGESLYIIMDDQTANDRSDFRSRRWDATLMLSICHKQDSSYTKDIVDGVCEQIESIIVPNTADKNGLPIQSGWQITNVSLANVSYADFQISTTETICVKFITFNFIITKI